MANLLTERLIYDVKKSSVGPGRVTTDMNLFSHEPSCMDLAMKLHYLQSVYFFSAAAAKDLTVTDFKFPMFSWLNQFPVPCGRFRRSESGQPFLKLNDCGVRVIEAQTSKTIDEWLEMDRATADRLLISNEAIGPELIFSPLVLIQITWFKCGGKSVGFSWAHVLGDPSSASYFINVLGQVMAVQPQPNGLENFNKAQDDQTQLKRTESKSKVPLSVKRVDPVGDYWKAPSNIKFETYSFRVSPKQLTILQSKTLGSNGPSPLIFEPICAIIWQCMARVREDHETIRTVTVCKNKVHGGGDGSLSNSQSIGVVKFETTSTSISDADLKELATLLVDHVVDERVDIETMMEEGQGLSDLIVYGKNLTFIDLGDVNLYGLELNGRSPNYVSYDIDGIGDEGLVLVLPVPDGMDERDRSRIVTVKLPREDMLKLKSELEMECLV